jgi:hypothetical protein
LAGKTNEIGRQKTANFPDAQLLKDYPATKAILRVPRHTIQMTGELSEAFVTAVKQVIAKRWFYQYPACLTTPKYHCLFKLT